MASAEKINSSEQIIEEILDENSTPEFSLMCDTVSAIPPTEIHPDKPVEDSLVTLPALIQDKDGSHSNMELVSLATENETSQSSLEPGASHQFVSEDGIGITGFQTVVGEMGEDTVGHVTLGSQCQLTVIEDLNYSDSGTVLIPKLLGEDTEDVTLSAEVKGEGESGKEETVQPQLSQSAGPAPTGGQVGTLVGVTDLGGNLVTIGGQHFLLFTAASQEAPAQSSADSSQDSQQPATKRQKTEDTLTSPLTEEGVESLVGFDAAHPDVHVELVEESQASASDRENAQEVEGSTDITQNWFTTRDDKNRLKMQNNGSSWKQGQWSKEEVDQLTANIDSYCQRHNISDPSSIVFGMAKDERKNFYRTVAAGLNRPLFSVYRRVLRMYDQKNHLGKYSPAEVQKLRELRGRLGSDWAAIGAQLGRSASSVKDRCRLMKDRCYSGKWLPEEEKKLTEAVYKLSGAVPGMDVTGGLSWSAVAEHVGSRTEKQCRTKWLNYLNWKNRGGSEWTRADDFVLIQKVCNLNISQESHINWEQLAKGWSSARSPQWLRGKWWSLKRHIIPDSQNITFQAILDQLKLSLKDLSQASAHQPELEYSVKIERPPSGGQIEGEETTTGVQQGHSTSQAQAEESAALVVSPAETAVTELPTPPTLVQTASSIQTQKELPSDQTYILYNDSGNVSVGILCPDTATPSQQQQVIQLQLNQQNGLISSE